MPHLTLSRVALIASVALVALPTQAGELWTDPPAKRTASPLTSIAPLVDRLEPAVLVVFTEAAFDPSALPDGHPPVDEDTPGLPPGFDPRDHPTMQGQGAGFVITKTGYALTNHHVIENAVSVRVRVGNSPEEYAAEVIGSDEKTDIALIKITSPKSDWPSIPLGDSEAMHVGDFVVAIGSPFGLEQSVSFGIISARGRKDIAPSGRTGLYDFIQTDASINPGNSGGPLLNLYGEVVGMNSAVNAAGSGIGFAIPINMVKRLLPQLKASGHVERSWIGVAIQDVPPELASDFGLARARGALIREVVDGGPAALAGIKPGDVIVGFDQHNIETSTELPLLAGDAGAGKAIKLDVMRDQKPLALTVTLGAHPDNAKAPVKKAEAPKKDEKEATLGVTVVTLNSDDKERMKLGKSTVGTRVSKLRPGSPAFMAGLQVDDVITSVNGKPTPNAAAFAEVVKGTEKKRALKMSVLRGKSAIFVAVGKP